MTREAALAAKRVIVVAEEVWPAARILTDPNLVLVPSIKVAAVVREPWGELPSPVQSYHGRDHELFTRYHAESKTPEGYRAWLDKWVLVRDTPATEAELRLVRACDPQGFWTR